MARPAQDITEAELAIMEVLWERESATVRQIKERLYPSGEGSQHATVQKLLDRLKRKGFVDRDQSVWPHEFTAAVDRDELIGRRLRKTAERLCGGSMQPLLTHLIRETKLSKKDRNSLRELLDELEKKR